MGRGVFEKQRWLKCGGEEGRRVHAERKILSDFLESTVFQEKFGNICLGGLSTKLTILMLSCGYSN